ncbi:ELMO domain-containing protein 3 [Clonorchis sinensis]|uniref:ELMO domain-containing protein 3 n=1 Tax=Clonorchis sinensis TaxID=79923 RepID=G7YKH9_CLOSI|nr:ELMO domain-containing protein 3 [Clonorchis sinensis]
MDVTLKVASEDCDKAQAVQLAEKPRIQRISPVRLLAPPPWPALSPSTKLSTTSFGDTQAEAVSPGLSEITDLKSKRDGTSIVSSEISFFQCLEQMNFPVKPITTPPLAPRRLWKRFRPFGWFRKRPTLKPNLLGEREFVYATVYTECQPFEDSLHGQMLYTIFKRFTGSPACLTKGDHWQLIGFQGSDPTTDFRGAGLLALLCLVYFATEPPFCNTVPSFFRQSLEPVYHFPFSLIGINLTTLLLQLMRQGHLNRLYNKQHSVLHTFMHLYSGLFYTFCKRWVEEKYTVLKTREILRWLEKRCRQNPRWFLKIKG